MKYAVSSTDNKKVSEITKFLAIYLFVSQK